MKIECYKIRNNILNEDFEFKLYGSNKGKPMMVFPCSKGRFFDYENFGMIETIKDYIENEDITVISVDSKDHITWLADNKDISMGINHLKYEKTITEEVIPYVKKILKTNEKFITTGNSWGAYHALNFHLKFPHLFDVSISLSGAYSLNIAIGNYYDDTVYFNDILMYLPNLTERKYIDELKKNLIIICHGLGSYETTNHEAQRVAQLLDEKNIPYIYDVWGENYPHDWPAWKEQIRKFLYLLKEGLNPLNKIFIGKNRKK